MRISNEMVDVMDAYCTRALPYEVIREALAEALQVGGFKEETRPIRGKWHGEEARVAGPWGPKT